MESHFEIAIQMHAGVGATEFNSVAPSARPGLSRAAIRLVCETPFTEPFDACRTVSTHDLFGLHPFSGVGLLEHRCPQHDLLLCVARDPPPSLVGDPESSSGDR